MCSRIFRDSESSSWGTIDSRGDVIHTSPLFIFLGGMCIMESMKIIRWTCSTQEVLDEEVHTIFHLGSKVMDKLVIGEPVKMIVDNGFEEVAYLGLAEVVSIKLCNISGIEHQDYLRQKSGYRNARESIGSFQKMYPKRKVNGNTEVSVVTIKRLTYDLRGLNKMMAARDRKGKDVGKKA